MAVFSSYLKTTRHKVENNLDLKVMVNRTVGQWFEIFFTLINLNNPQTN